MPRAIDPLQHYEVITETGCWIWLGYITSDGYGTHGRPQQRIHRTAYEAANGPIPDGMDVCHKCDVRCCMNPAHLFAGAKADNNDDMRRKGRQPAGERSGRAKLTLEQVADIRRRLAAGERQADIAADHGVHQVNISCIKTGKTWVGGQYKNANGGA